jgi:biotin carboxyl carrier protein
MHYQLNIGGRDFAVEVDAEPAGGLRVSVDGTPYDVAVTREATSTVPRPALAKPDRKPSPGGETAVTPAVRSPPAESVGGAVLAPIPGLILEIKVQVGAPVEAGQAVAVMEAMKMENNLVTHVSGTVGEILVQKGSEVATGDVIMRIV